MVAQQTVSPQSAPQAPAWQAKALALAEAKGIIGTGRGVRSQDWPRTAQDIPQAVIVRVASQTQADTHYDLWYALASDTATCTCAAAQYGRPCCHAGVALAYGRAAKRLYTLVAR